ncbi:MAG: hypothetical protein KME07_08590 [Pegethrix bostrychoides GSE-TBD4-15B]|uniref:Uncharacterized protein n=1 Tax=Pegethrix bostrychoides GSE-TBD4-15B TaxID=2839662 RepID=A0A951PAR0_9CYAN|nr:hypothetical protein [Pegethrix bostrychoides GSE-TBD4-15B]
MLGTNRKFSEKDQMQIKSEQLAYWYLRLNGFLTIPNFVVHPDRGSNQETDVDILAVRFPYRGENLENPMHDEEHFTAVKEKSYIALAEVKSGICNLNGPWTNPKRQNMLRVVRALGAFPEAESKLVSKSLYERGIYSNQLYYVSLLCLGRDHNSDVTEKYPNVPQILWPNVLRFIHKRFHEYRQQKKSHPQWDQAGHCLWDAYQANKTDVERFLSNIDING